MYLFLKFSFSPDTILCGWLGIKPPTNQLTILIRYHTLSHREDKAKLLPPRLYVLSYRRMTLHHSNSVQFSPLTDWVVGGTWGTIQQKTSSSLFCRRPLWAILAWTGMSTRWCCPSSIYSADHGVASPSRCPEGWFWRGCRGVWHVRTMQVSVSWHLAEEVPVDPQGSWSCSAPSRWPDSRSGPEPKDFFGRVCHANVSNSSMCKTNASTSCMCGPNVSYNCMTQTFIIFVYMWPNCFPNSCMCETSVSNIFMCDTDVSNICMCDPDVVCVKQSFLIAVFIAQTFLMAAGVTQTF